MGGSPNALVQHLAGETSLLGTTGFQPWLPGPSVIMRGGNGHGRAHHNDNIPNKHRLEEQIIWDAHDAAVREVILEAVIEDFAHEEQHFRFIKNNTARQKPEDTFLSAWQVGGTQGRRTKQEEPQVNVSIFGF